MLAYHRRGGAVPILGVYLIFRTRRPCAKPSARALPHVPDLSVPQGSSLRIVVWRKPPAISRAQTSQPADANGPAKRIKCSSPNLAWAAPFWRLRRFLIVRRIRGWGPRGLAEEVAPFCGREVARLPLGSARGTSPRRTPRRRSRVSPFGMLGRKGWGKWESLRVAWP